MQICSTTLLAYDAAGADYSEQSQQKVLGELSKAKTIHDQLMVLKCTKQFTQSIVVKQDT
jgi:hypothetical protein